MGAGTPFNPGIVAVALYLRFTHAISYQRLCRLFAHLFGLTISEGALDAIFPRAKPCFDSETVAILARLRRSRAICSDETSVRIDDKTFWNWVFQNDAVVIHVIRKSRGAAVVTEVMDGHRPAIWVSDLYGAQQGHADAWQVCVAHQLRHYQFAIDAGDSVFAPRMKALLLRAGAVARRRHDLAKTTRREYRRRLDNNLGAIMALAPKIATASACENAMAKSGATSSHSSSTANCRPTTTAPSVNSAQRPPIASHRWLPLRLGCRSLCRSPIRHRNRWPPRRRRLCCRPQYPIRAGGPRTGLSRYKVSAARMNKNRKSKASQTTDQGAPDKNIAEPSRAIPPGFRRSRDPRTPRGSAQRRTGSADEAGCSRSSSAPAGHGRSR